LAIVDGTLIPTDRLGGDNNRLITPASTTDTGVNLQGLINSAGHMLWISDGLPGSVHDLTAARADGIIDAITAAEIQTLADKDYQGAGDTFTTPIKAGTSRSGNATSTI
jgi:hypothetical protein